MNRFRCVSPGKAAALESLILLTGLLLALAFLPACRLPPPGLEVRALGPIEVVSVGDEAMTIVVEVELANPRERAIRFRDLNVEAGLADGLFAHTSLDREWVFEPQSRQRLQLPMSLSFAKLSAADYASLFAEELPFRLAGTVDVVAPVRWANYPLTLRGHLPRPDALSILLPRANHGALVTWTGAQADLPGLLGAEVVGRATLRNPFTFPVSVGTFHYRAALGDRQVGSGRLDHPIDLQPGPNAIALPLRLRPLGLATGLLDGVLGRRPLHLAVTGSLHLQRESLQRGEDRHQTVELILR